MGAVLGIPTQAPAAEPVHRTLSAKVPVSAPAVGRIVDARLPWRANLVGIAFPDARGAGGIDAEMRAFDGSSWSPWVAVDADNDDAPDGAELARASFVRMTDPVWVGAADRVQIRVTPERGVRVGVVQVHALNTAGDATQVSLPLRIIRSIGRFLSMQPQAAEAITSTPKIIPRAQWGGSALAARPRHFAGYASDVKMVFLHHTDNSNSYTKSQSAALVRGIHRYHTSNRGYSDIAYNFLVDRYGQIFEGRWGGTTRPVIGAHTLGFNRSTAGISLLGTYSGLTPPRAMQTSLKRLLAWKMDVHHIPVVGTVVLTSAGNERYAAGTRVRFNRIAGHRNAKPTACPGTRAYNLLPSFRTGANGMGHPKIVLPTAWTTTGLNSVRPDGDGIDEAIRFKASFTRSVDWTLKITGAMNKTFSGTGTSMNLVWDPSKESTPPPTGRYAWRLDARLPGGGTVARAWTGTLYIVTDHPAGTLVGDASGYYVVGSRPSRSDTTVVSRKTHFGDQRAVLVGPRERERYPIASQLSLREGALLLGPDGASRYIVSGGTLRRFVDDDVFTALGYSLDALIPADSTTIAAQPAGAPVQDVTRHPDGTVVRDPATGEVWVITTGVLRPIEGLALASRYRAIEVVPAVPGDLALTRDLAPIDLREGTLLAGPTGLTYVYTGGLLRRFVDNTLYLRMGYVYPQRLAATQEQLDALPAGSVLG